MGLIPKHSAGDLAIGHIYNPSLEKDVEYVFKVEKVKLMWDSLFKFEWSYIGKYYSVASANPLKLKYATTGGIRESNFVPLESRIDMGQWAPEEAPCSEKLPYPACHVS
jgi:hypothetical protein